MSTADESVIDRIRQLTGRAAFRGVVTGLSAGIALRLLRQPEWSSTVLAWTCGLLVAIPIVNVLWVLLDEIRRRDWVFVGLAVAVLGLIAYSLAVRLGLTL